MPAATPRSCAGRYHSGRSLPNAPRAPLALSRLLPRTAIGSSASAPARSCGAARADLMEQPGAREPDITMHGRRRGSGRLCNLFVGQAAEIMQFDDLRETRFELHQALEGIVERNDIKVRGRQRVRVDGNNLPGAGIAFDSRARL